MPVQAGMYKTLGKFEGRSYYKSKRDSRYRYRGISPALGDNVRTLPQFETLRLNSYEFGGCVKLAGAVSTLIARGGRAYLEQNLTAKIAVFLRDIMREDATHPLGQRQLVGTSWQAGFLQRVMRMQKNDADALLSGLESTITATRAGNRDKVEISFTAHAAFLASLRSIGATHCRLDFGGVGARLRVPTDGQSPKYVLEISGMSRDGVHSMDVHLGEDTEGALNFYIATRSGFYGDNALPMCRLLVTPMQMVGGTLYPIYRKQFVYLASIPPVV